MKGEQRIGGIGLAVALRSIAAPVLCGAIGLLPFAMPPPAASRGDHETLAGTSAPAGDVRRAGDAPGSVPSAPGSRPTGERPGRGSLRGEPDPAPAEDDVDRVPPGRGPDTTVLTNGLRVVFLEAHSNPMVASTVAVLSGVRDETARTNGASHLLEHLLFNGTARRTQKQLYDEVEFLGGYNNASTRDEYTLFQFLVHRDHLREALDIQSDMLFHSTIPASLFDKERKIVLEEMARDESDPAYGADQFFRRCYFADDPRSRPVLGTSASIEAMTREDVIAHYRKHYLPGRMVLLLAGDFDREQAKQLLQATFGQAKRPEDAVAGEADPASTGSDGSRKPGGLPARSASSGTGRKPAGASGGTGGEPAGASGGAGREPVGASSGTSREPAGAAPEGAPGKGAAGGPGRGVASASADRSASARSPADRSATAIPPRRAFKPPKPGLYRQRTAAPRGYLRFGLPAPGVGDPDAATIRAIVGLLGGGAGSRLAAALASADSSLVIDASAAFNPGAGAGVFEIDATLPADSSGVEAIKAIRRELDRLAREPASLQELRGIVSQEKASLIYLRDQVHYLGMTVAPNLILGPSPSLGLGAEAMEALTPALVQKAARKWLQADPVVTVSSPSAASSEAADGPRALPPFEPAARRAATEGAEAGEGRRGAAGPDGARSRPVRRVDFENGLILLVAENPDSEVFAAHILVRDRAAVEPPERDGIADLLHRLLPYGSLFLDERGLAEKLHGIGARLKTVDDPTIPYDDYYSSPRYSYVRFETIRENWREGMGLLFTTVEYPRLEPRDVALALSEEIDLSRKGQESPAALARALYAKTVLGGGPLARPIAGTPITLTPINAEDLKAFHARYLAPDQLILSIVSSVSASDVVEVVRASFGSLPPGPGAASLPPLKPGETRRRISLLAEPPATTAASRMETRAGKEQSQILVGGIFARDAADLAPLIAATTILSGRIGRDLRETRGLAYSVGCSIEDYGSRSWFTASMGTRPANVDEAETALREAIRKFSLEEVPQSEVERSINAMRGQVAMRRMTRISQAYSLGFNELLGRDTAFDAQLDAALAAVKAADVQRVARRYLDPDRMVTAVAR